MSSSLNSVLEYLNEDVVISSFTFQHVLTPIVAACAALVYEFSMRVMYPKVEDVEQNEASEKAYACETSERAYACETSEQAYACETFDFNAQNPNQTQHQTQSQFDQECGSQTFDQTLKKISLSNKRLFIDSSSRPAFLSPIGKSTQYSKTPKRSFFVFDYGVARDDIDISNKSCPLPFPSPPSLSSSLTPSLLSEKTSVLETSSPSPSPPPSPKHAISSFSSPLSPFPITQSSLSSPSSLPYPSEKTLEVSRTERLSSRMSRRHTPARMSRPNQSRMSRRHTPARQGTTLDVCAGGSLTDFRPLGTDVCKTCSVLETSSPSSPFSPPYSSPSSPMTQSQLLVCPPSPSSSFS